MSIELDKSDQVPVKTQDSHSDVLADFLAEFANHLLASGISAAEFRSAAQMAFVQAALGSARLRNSRVNQSAVAAVTGLSRTQVRALLRAPPIPPNKKRDRLNAVTSGWRTDPEFTDEGGNPRALSVLPGSSGFPELVKKYGRDVSHPAILSELRKLRRVTHSTHMVMLNSVAKNTKQIEMTRLLSQGLAHVIRNAATGNIQVTTGEATHMIPDHAPRALLRRRVVQGAKAFAADLQAAGDAIASRPTGKRRLRKVSTRILVVTVD